MNILEFILDHNILLTIIIMMSKIYLQKLQNIMLSLKKYIPLKMEMEELEDYLLIMNY